MLTILRKPKVKERTGLSNSQIYKLISENKFPRQIKLSARASGWIESEIEEWIKSRITESRGLSA